MKIHLFTRPLLVIFCLIYFISFNSTFARSTTPQVQLELSSIQVSPLKTTGKSWDLTGKPDLLIQVWVNQSLLKSFDIKKDTLETTFNQTITAPFEYKKGETKIEIKVLDEDIDDNDFIGSLDIDLQLSVDKPIQNLQFKAGSILDFSLKAKLLTSYVSEQNQARLTLMKLQVNALKTQMQSVQNQAEASEQKSKALNQRAEAAEAEVKVLKEKEKVAKAKIKGVTQEIEIALKELNQAQKTSQTAEQKAQMAEAKAKQSAMKATQAANRAEQAEQAAQKAKKASDQAQAVIKDKEGALAKTRGELASTRKQAKAAEEANKKRSEQAAKRIALAKKAAEEANKVLKQIEDLPSQ
jgi:hypothetical protein